MPSSHSPCKLFLFCFVCAALLVAKPALAEPPMLTHALKVELPRASSQSHELKRENVHFSLDAEGRAFWNGEPVERADWQARMATAARIEPQSELPIHADGELAYKHVVSVMSDASRAGLTRIGFVTEPQKGG